MPRTDTNSPDWATFQGYSSPNYTQVPDELFDQHLAYLSGAELKVLLYIIRRTFGFKKNADNISIAQIMQGIRKSNGEALDFGTGLSRDSVTRAVQGLEDKKLILRRRRWSAHKGDEANAYQLNHDTRVRKSDTPTPVSENRTPPGGTIGHPRVRKSDTQETVLQQTDLSSNIRRAAQAVDNSEPAENAQQGTTRQPTDTTGHNRHVAANPLTNGANSGTHQHMPKVVRSPSRADAHTSTAKAPTRQGHGQNNGPEPLGAILNRHTLRPEQADAREAIESYITDMAREFGDKAKLKSSVTRAYNLYEHSGRTLHGFVDALFLARANVKERQDSTTQDPINNRMSYFFSVLEDQLGLKADVQAQGQGHSATKAGSKSPQSLSPPD